MSTDGTPPLTWNDVIAAIGGVSVGWGFLEGEMRTKLRKAGLREEIARGSIITHWRAYIRELSVNSGQGVISDLLDPVDQLAVTRNLLAHGIQSVSMDPYGDDGAVVMCAGSDGVVHKLTIESIRTLVKDIDRVRMSIQGSRVAAM